MVKCALIHEKKFGFRVYHGKRKIFCDQSHVAWIYWEAFGLRIKNVNELFVNGFRFQVSKLIVKYYEKMWSYFL